MESLTAIAPRRLEAIVPHLLEDEPVLVLTGPRTVGKSTLLRRLAERLGAGVLDLDDLTTRGLVRDDLAFYVGGPPPVLVDEYQHVPDLLDAIKAELNVDPQPGRFLLAGSTSYSTLPRTAQSLTGRVHVVTVWPLSQGEIEGRAESFVQRMLDDPASVTTRRSSETRRTDVVGRVLDGGLPAVLRRRPGRPRTRWYENYLNLIIERDVLGLSGIRQSAVLPVYLRRLAAQTGQVLNVARASRESDITPSVGEDYTRLLESVFLVHRLPAWGTTLSGRVNRSPKIHLVDSGLGGWLLGITARGVDRRIPGVLSEFGHLFETFVVNELLKQLSWLDAGHRLGHYRTFEGHEVDLVIDNDEGHVIGVEVKAGGTYRAEDLRGLSHLRDRVGDRFLGGVLIYNGQRAATVGDRLHLVPVDSLWEM